MTWDGSSGYTEVTGATNMNTLPDRQGRLEDYSLTNRNIQELGWCAHIGTLQTPYEQPCSAQNEVSEGTLWPLQPAQNCSSQAYSDQKPVYENGKPLWSRSSGLTSGDAAVDLRLWAKDLSNFSGFIAADLSPLMRCRRIIVGQLTSLLCCYTGRYYSVQNKYTIIQILITISSWK